MLRWLRCTAGWGFSLLGKEVALTRRTVVTATAALVMAAMMVAMAMPALAARPTPTKQECRETLVAIVQGEKLTGQQKQLPQRYETFGECIQASN